MCGRYTLSTPDESLADYFELADVPALEPRYNVAPTQPVAVVRAGPEGGLRRLDLLRWGLVPGWAEDLSVGARMINARSETVSTRSAFRDAFRLRRCLVPADGFFEWRKMPGGKQPLLYRLEEGGPFGFAGLWEWWRSRAGDEVESFTILTTDANETVAPVHDRMPVILERGDHARWLDPAVTDPTALQDLLRPLPAGRLVPREVSRRVNSPHNDDAACLEPPE